jgi:hypothetical protein
VPLVGGPPGTELHTVGEGLPSGAGGDMIPVVLTTLGVAMVPNAVDDIVVVDGVIAVAPLATDGTVVPPMADMEVTGTAGVPGVICPVGVAQVTTVPGIVGSEASGTGASVVSGAPGWVVAENGLGALSGDVTIAAGVDGSPMAVVPMVETCAEPALQHDSRTAVINNKPRIAIVSSTPI